MRVAAETLLWPRRAIAYSSWYFRKGRASVDNHKKFRVLLARNNRYMRPEGV
jgi:hypothetical protein